MDSADNNVQGVINFPCHSKEKILVYEGAVGRCSVKCPYCDKFALFDFDKMTSKPIGAARGEVDRIKKRKELYRLSR